MTSEDTETRTLTMEREFAHPPERVWRALTQSELLAEWIMPNDFRAEIGARFSMDADWGKVEGEVLAVEPQRRLRYTWNGPGLQSQVEWRLEPAGAGTRLMLEQTGFRPQDQQAYYGARAGWPRFLKTLDTLLERID
ncbi:SRPBCC family protein [Pelagerythrobacter marensis]|uniref:Polyketide cyclase n=1 Tax=Pelagerythrobacter marensis TaxID=543877 RepID=A0A0G3X659_9SPHN|nr:SRPBCC domain-containing protein [Pelagerythrobacter marensis]AKM06702.1 polyketide cyclase [Pelagerythrobacter marensis]